MQIRTTASALATAVLLTTVVGTVDISAAAVGAGTTGGCTPTWKIVATPPAADITLASVSAFSSRDAWFTGLDESSYDRLAWHWDGNAITETAPIPTGPFFFQAYSHDVPTTGSFSSDTDGWMLMGDDQSSLAIADRWHDGRWTRIPLAVSPDPRDLAHWVTSIAPVSATDAWAFGATYSRSLGLRSLGALIEHWDGVRWSVVPNPASAKERSILERFKVISATDVWALGRTAGAEGAPEPLVEHWDGAQWSIIAIAPAASPASVSSVSASGPNDVWVAGAQTMAGTVNTAVPLVEHWDGTTWTVMTNLPDLGNAAIDSVFAAGPGDVWAAVQQPGQGVTSFLHWDGKTWTTVPSPEPARYGLSYQFVLGGTGPADIWGVGAVTNLSAGARNVAQVIHLTCGKD